MTQDTSFNILKTSNHSKLRKAGGILREAFSLILFELKVGKKLSDLDREIGKFLRDNNASATSKLLGSTHHFSACLNHEVINGLPDDRLLTEQDLVTVDMSIFHQGVFVDKAISVIIPPVSGKKKYLLATANKCLEAGIAAARAGCTNLSIGSAIEMTAKYYGMTPSSRFRGHGIGSAHHMEPVIPNMLNCDVVEEIIGEGQAVAIEPVIFFNANHRLEHVGSTIVANCLSVHVEDTIIVHNREAEVIT